MGIVIVWALYVKIDIHFEFWSVAPLLYVEFHIRLRLEKVERWVER
jgi:hypothetical protein